MRYIRFLKVPKVKDDEVQATITITSDLGETFFDADVGLAATIRSADHDGDVYLRKVFKWKAGMRALPISFTISHCDLDWPIRVHVGLKSASSAIDSFQRHHNAADLPHIISVWSDILDPSQNIVEATRTVERRFMPLSNRTLCMWEETGDSIARHLWDGGIALTAYLDRMVALQVEGLPLLEESIGSASYKKLHVLELGCGCGIVGISLAQTVPDCEVIITDMPEATEIATRNISAMNPAMSSLVKFEPLDWSAPLPQPIASKIFDIVLVSECTYNTDSIPALIQTLASIVKRSPKAIVLIGTKVRHESEAMFLDLLKKADFVKASHTDLKLPEDEESTEPKESVQVYVFHEKANPLPLVWAPAQRRSVVRFWDDQS